MAGPNYTVIPGDWSNLEYIINDLCSRIINEDASFTDYLLKNGSRALTANWNAGTYKITTGSLVVTGLTSGRVPYLTTGDLFTDSANLTFDGTNLTCLGYGTLSYINITDETNGFKIDGERLLSSRLTGSDLNLFIGLAGNSTMTGVHNLYAGWHCGLGNTTGIDNFGWGYQCLENNTTGNDNIAIGFQSLVANIDGSNNIGISGLSALTSNTSGSRNISIGGGFTLALNTSGNDNIGIGYECLNNNTTGDFNVGIGSSAGQANAGGNNIFLGAYSGYRQTSASNLLIIDNQDRGSIANEITNCLIYGVFDATPANQTLRMNAAVTGINFISNVAIGTQPYACTSTTVNTNLNADLLDGEEATAFQDVDATLTALAGLDATTGFLKQTAADTFAKDSFGTATYVPYSSGTGLSYSANLLFDGSDLRLNGYFGMNAAGSSIYPINFQHTVDANAPYMNFRLINAREDANAAGTYCLYFASYYAPTDLTAHRKITALGGVRGVVIVQNEAGAGFSAYADEAYGANCGVRATTGTGASSPSYITTGYAYYAPNSIISGTGTYITTAYAFYDVGQTTAVTNWGLGINTQSYINAGLRIGDTTAPTDKLEVNGVSNLGDGGSTNYSEFLADGELNLHGTARVIKYSWISAEAIHVGGVSPASLTLNGNGFSVISFADNADKWIQANIKIPADMDLTADSYICIGWSSPATEEDAIVDVHYIITAPDDSTDDTPIDDTGNVITSSATADGLVVSPLVTIAGSTITSSDVCLHVQIMRDGDNGDDTLGDVLELHGLAFKYTASKLGEAT